MTAPTPSRRIKALAIATRAVVSLLVVALGVGVMVLLERTRPEAPKEAAAVSPPRVAALEISRQAVRRPWRGYGTAQAVTAADVPARVGAVVRSIPRAVEEGRRVARGDLLVELDASDFEREVESARQRLAEAESVLAQLEVERDNLETRFGIEAEELELAEVELARVQSLFERGASTQRELDASRRSVLISRLATELTRDRMDQIGPRRLQVEAQRGALRSALRRAEDDLERTRILSPIDGVLQSVDVKLAESVAVGQRVARVVSLERIETPLRLPAGALEEVAVGDRATLQAASGTGLAWQASVSRIAPEADPASRTVTVFIEVEQPHAQATFGSASNERLLTPGMFLLGVVTGRELEQQWIVPRRSVRGGRLMLVNDGVVTSIPVEVRFGVEGILPGVDLPDDQWAVIDGPLRDGQWILVDGSMSLLDGARVEPRVIAMPRQAAGPADAREAAP